MLFPSGSTTWCSTRTRVWWASSWHNRNIGDFRAGRSTTPTGRWSTGCCATSGSGRARGRPSTTSRQLSAPCQSYPEPTSCPRSWWTSRSNPSISLQRHGPARASRGPRGGRRPRSSATRRQARDTPIRDADLASPGPHLAHFRYRPFNARIQLFRAYRARTGSDSALVAHGCARSDHAPPRAGRSPGTPGRRRADPRRRAWWPDSSPPTRPRPGPGTSPPATWSRRCRPASVG